MYVLTPRCSAVPLHRGGNRECAMITLGCGSTACNSPAWFRSRAWFREVRYRSIIGELCRGRNRVEREPSRQKLPARHSDSRIPGAGKLQRLGECNQGSRTGLDSWSFLPMGELGLKTQEEAPERPQLMGRELGLQFDEHLIGGRNYQG
ncbi:hypothetical protein BDP55DRAFT_634269 [Colletotrichum godetiae]|uniref:Uncharacterized protein n=1 Tax=Colletotrichum godetiae TaxID=1209918 RepID=A0AAJ0AG82_9PEZI|nr:uncharacterized protein BDP55DRAFT_634269 [Colletotrichum godetiae]KAK1673331.1 hypothetical protein BDP55DRAFT_634269 [Colletotrichum godetiae]